MTRIVLADDHEMFRTGLRTLLEKQGGLQVVGEAADGRELLELVRSVSPEIVITDITMPGANGVEATRRLLEISPQAKIIALSMHSERPFVTVMLRAGAKAYLLKNSAASELLLAIESVQRGETFLSPKIAGALVEGPVRRAAAGERSSVFAALTPREREVLQLLAEGRTSKQIGSVLNISVKTVETHRSQIMDKLGIRTVAELTKYAVREGLTSLDM